MLTLRTLQSSRLAMLAAFAVGSAMSSLSQRRPRAIDDMRRARFSERIARASCGGTDAGTRISHRRLSGGLCHGTFSILRASVVIEGTADMKGRVASAQSIEIDGRPDTSAIIPGRVPWPPMAAMQLPPTARRDGAMIVRFAEPGRTAGRSRCSASSSKSAFPTWRSRSIAADSACRSRNAATGTSCK